MFSECPAGPNVKAWIQVGGVLVFNYSQDLQETKYLSMFSLHYFSIMLSLLTVATESVVHVS